MKNDLAKLLNLVDAYKQSAFYFKMSIADWAIILEQLGLSDYAVLIGNVIIFGAIFLFVLTLWSVFYYIKHMDQYPIPYSATH